MVPVFTAVLDSMMNNLEWEERGRKIVGEYVTSVIYALLMMSPFLQNCRGLGQIVEKSIMRESRIVYMREAK